MTNFFRSDEIGAQCKRRGDLLNCVSFRHPQGLRYTVIAIEKFRMFFKKVEDLFGSGHAMAHSGFGRTLKIATISPPILTRFMRDALKGRPVGLANRHPFPVFILSPRGVFGATSTPSILVFLLAIWPCIVSQGGQA